MTMDGGTPTTSPSFVVDGGGPNTQFPNLSVPIASIDPELMELLESEVTISSTASRGLDGKQAFGVPVTYRAHISNRRDKVRNASGEEVLSNGSADLDGAYPGLSESDQLTLPDGTTPSIVAISLSYDSNGPYQTTVYW